MSLRGKILIGLISIFCFCLGVTATIMFSSNRSFQSALPGARAYTLRLRSSRLERNFRVGVSSQSFEDNVMSQTISDMSSLADAQTLDRLALQVSRLESSGRAYLGVHIRSGDNCAIVYRTEYGTPAYSVFRSDDAIIAIGTFVVTDADSLRRALVKIEPGVPVSVRYYRDGSIESATVYPISMQVGQLPYSHRALGIAYESAGRPGDAAQQFESYRREARISSDVEDYYHPVR